MKRRRSLGPPDATPSAAALDARAKRAERRALDLCVNGCGPRTHGCRCFPCSLVHRHGFAEASIREDYKTARRELAEQKEAARAVAP